MPIVRVGGLAERSLQLHWGARAFELAVTQQNPITRVEDPLGKAIGEIYLAEAIADRNGQTRHVECQEQLLAPVLVERTRRGH